MRLLMICVLSHLLQVVVPQMALEQTPALQTMAVGNTVKIHCYKRMPSLGSAVGWFRQRHNEKLKRVYTVSQTHPHGIQEKNKPDRYHHIFTIENAQRNNSGTYYCSTSNFTSGSIVFGNGSKVIIADGPPRIYILSPPSDEILSMDTVPLMCVVTGVTPGSSPILWRVAGQHMEGLTDSGIIEPDGTYSIRSQINISLELWKSGAVCTCIHFNSTENTGNQTASYQKESSAYPVNRVLLYAIPTIAFLVLLGILIVAVRKITQNCKTVTESRNDPTTDVRAIKQQNETLYARLAIREDSGL